MAVHRPSAGFAHAALAISPVLVAVGVYGTVFGALAARAGFAPLDTAAMSAAVFAGAAQFVALEVWTSPPQILLLAATAAMVNLRHVLMGAAIAPALADWPRRRVYLALFFLTDENWALAMRHAATAPLTPRYYFGLALPLYATWIACTTLGTALGGLVEDPARFGLDFAFTAVFLTLLVGLWQGRRSVPPWVASAAVAVAAHLWLPGVWYIVLGALAGAAAGAARAGGEDGRA